ncbi:HTH-type transcriptional regulator YesS [compost metagenome]
MHFGISPAGSLPGRLASQRIEAAEALLRRNLLRHEDYSHFSVSSGEYRQDVVAAGARPIFADVQEDWKMAVVSGNMDALSAAAQHWTEELSRSGVITPEMLGSWKADALLFRSRLVREALGSRAESALAELELADRDNPAPYATGYSFSLFAWRDWSFSLMLSLSRVLSAGQVKERNPLTEIVKYIDQNYQSDLSLQEVAGKFYVSREYISRKFKQEYGINFTDYIGSVRIEKAKLLLQNHNLKLSQISEMTGFHDVKYFSKVFKKQTGVTPKDYRIQATL